MRAAARLSPRGQRPLLRELGTYLKGVADMRDIDSNSVYVVSLGRGRDTGWSMTYVEVVEEYNRYFYPAAGKGWPKVPPNYIAFRYDGRLQSIRHVDDYTVATDMSDFFPGVPSNDWDPHFVVSLGPAIVPSQSVPNGGAIRRAMRAWADIDLLLTAPSISDALARTKGRRSA